MGPVTSLIFVAVANQSLQDNFQRAQDSASLPEGLPEPGEVARKWEGLRIAGKSGRICPFSELSPLHATGILDAYDEVGIVVLGGSNVDALLPLAAQRPDGAGRFTHDEYVRSYCAQVFAAKVTSVEYRQIGDYEVRNDSPYPAAIRALILDHAARLEELRGESVEVAVNEFAGATVAQLPLIEAADAFGWQRWDQRGPVRPRIERKLDSSALAHQWGVARSVMNDFEAGLLGDGHDGVTRALELAETRDAIQFAIPRVTGGGLHSVAQNRFGMRLFRSHVGTGRSYYSATQRLLQSQPDEEARRLGVRLTQLLEHWARADLFGANQVSELVTHTDSHCEAVDRNVAAFAGPLLADGTLTARDAFHLAVAAWLHDWGHSGAAWSRRAVLAAIRDPGDLRAAHGLLSAERIRQLPRQTSLKPEEAQVPAIIAAHHQGWSTIELDEHPGDRLPEGLVGLDDELLVLTREIGEARKQGLADQDESRIPLLIAIFRVCDAADVGVHRAFYEEVLNDRVRDEIALYAHATLRPLAPPGQLRDFRWDGYLNALNTGVEESLEKGLPPDEFTGPDWVPVSGEPAEAAARAIVERARFCLKQPGYFRHHSVVLGVHLGVSKNSDGLWVVRPYVTPRDPKQAGAATFGVAQDVCRELGDNVSEDPLTASPNKKEPHKAAVKRILRDAGIVVEVAVPAE